MKILILILLGVAFGWFSRALIDEMINPSKDFIEKCTDHRNWALAAVALILAVLFIF